MTAEGRIPLYKALNSERVEASQSLERKALTETEDEKSTTWQNADKSTLYCKKHGELAPLRSGGWYHE
jgi:hypothetical protein